MKDYKDLAMALQSALLEIALPKESIMKVGGNNQYVTLTGVNRVLKDLIKSLELDNIKSTPIKKFLFIEDGSLDADDLTVSLAESNPEIQVVVYRQGSARPVLIDKDGQD